MPIEFYCPECDTFLRTSDSKAGLSARCPACSENIWVPYESDVFDDDLDEEPITYRTQLPSEMSSTSAERVNPFVEERIEETEFADETFADEGRLCGACGEVNAWNAQQCEGCGNPLAGKQSSEIYEVNLGDILSVTWKIYSKNLGICVIAALVDFLMILASLIVVLIPSLIFAVGLNGNRNLMFPAFFIVLFLGFGVSLAALWIGHFRFFLQLVRGEKPEIKLMFHVGNLVGRMVVASFIFSVIIGLGTMMCVFPGLLLFVLLWPFGRVLVDQNCSAFQSLTRASKLVIENFWCSVGVVTIFVGIMIVANGTVIGFLFSIPFNAVLFTVSYLHFSGEYVTGEPS